MLVAAGKIELKQGQTYADAVVILAKDIPKTLEVAIQKAPIITDRGLCLYGSGRIGSAVRMGSNPLEGREATRCVVAITRGQGPHGPKPFRLSAPISLCSPAGRVTPRYGVFSGPVKKWVKRPSSS